MDFGAIFQSALRSALGPDAAAYALLAIGLNMQFGHTGLANFGQVGFMLLAAYGVGVTVATIGWSMWLGIFLGLAVCVVFALLMGIPTLKLRADYFAITTIAAAEILRILARSTSAEDVTGGPFGLQDFSGPFLRLNPWDQDENRAGLGRFLENLVGPWALGAAALALAVAVLAVLAVLSLRRPNGQNGVRAVGAQVGAAVAAWVAGAAVVALGVVRIVTTFQDSLGLLAGIAWVVVGLAVMLVGVGVFGVGVLVFSRGSAELTGVILKVVAGAAAGAAIILALGHWSVNEVVFERFQFLQTQYWTMAVAWTLVALASVFVALLMSSPWGRVIRSVREDEDVASSVGKNVFNYKLQALVIGGVIGGLAGVMSAMGNSTVNNQTFIPLVTFFAYTCLILGGVGSRVGPAFGAMLFWFTFRTAQSTLSELNANDWLPEFLGGSEARGALAGVLMGVLLLTVTAFRPQGVFGKREDMVFGD